MKQNTARQQQNHSSRAITRVVKLPAKAAIAVLPAFLLFCFLLMAFRTAHGQAPQENQKTEVQQLIERLAQVDFDQRDAAEQKLIKIGSPAVDPLIRKLLDCKPDVCSRVKRILQAITNECDEESLFKALAALQARFEVPTERVRTLLDSWAVQRRQAVVARWRQQGAIVEDYSEGIDLEQERDRIEHLVQLQIARQQGFRFEGVDKNGKAKSQPGDSVNEADVPVEPVVLLPIEKQLQLVLDGSLEQNKELVLSTEKGAAGFKKSVDLLEKQPVFVTIGKDWQGDYSDFDFSKTRSHVSISSLTVQKKEITDSLLSGFRKHPLAVVTLNDCSIAASVTKKLPASLQVLAIENSDTPTKMLDLVSRDSTALDVVRFISSKFGKTQVAALKEFPHVSGIELERIDLEKEAFESLASLDQLQKFGIVRCKFPAAPFLKFREERAGVVEVEFSPKAFLGVSNARDMVFRRNGRLPRQVVEKGCIVATVLSGEAADKAGMKAGDQVLSVGDQKVQSFDELRVAIAQCDIGEQVSIKIRRDGKEEMLKVMMGAPDDLK